MNVDYVFIWEGASKLAEGQNNLMCPVTTGSDDGYLLPRFQMKQAGVGVNGTSVVSISDKEYLAAVCSFSTRRHL